MGTNNWKKKGEMHIHAMVNQGSRGLGGKMESYRRRRRHKISRRTKKTKKKERASRSKERGIFGRGRRKIESKRKIQQQQLEEGGKSVGWGKADSRKGAVTPGKKLYE